MTWMIAMALAGGLVALLCIVLARPAAATPGAAHDLEIYRDQLAELDRELAAGLVGAAEAEAARAEIARRMIGAARGIPPGSARPGTAAAGAPDRIPLAALAACILLPMLALGIYADRGRPGMPAVPAGSASSPASQAQMIRGMVDGLAARLAADPGDVQGWRRLARRRWRPTTSRCWASWRSCMRPPGPRTRSRKPSLMRCAGYLPCARTTSRRCSSSVSTAPGAETRLPRAATGRGCSRCCRRAPPWPRRSSANWTRSPRADDNPLNGTEDERQQ